MTLLKLLGQLFGRREEPFQVYDRMKLELASKIAPVCNREEGEGRISQLKRTGQENGYALERIIGGIGLIVDERIIPTIITLIYRHKKHPEKIAVIYNDGKGGEALYSVRKAERTLK